MEYVKRKIKINLNRKAEYNKIPILIYADDLVYGVKAKKTCFFQVELLEAPKDLGMYIRALNPKDEKFTITPTKVNDTTFLVELKENQKDIIGKYPFEIVITSDDQEMTIFQGEYKIKSWLTDKDVYIDKEVK